MNIEKPKIETDKIVVFLPGLSGGAMSDRFLPLVEACHQAGLAVVRATIWDNQEEVEKMSLNEIYKEVDDYVQKLKELGFNHIYGVGKSFGGAVMLTHSNLGAFEKKVLWAPAIRIDEAESNISQYLNTKLKDVSSLFEIKLNKQDLENFKTPTLVIHGTNDDNIPLSNSEVLISMLPEAKIVKIEGADHSYRNKDHESAVIKETVNFLTP